MGEPLLLQLDVDFDRYGALLPTGLVALAVLLLTWAVLQILTSPRVLPAGATHFEAQRRARLRAASATYRWCEPLIDEMAKFCSVNSPRALQLAHDLRLARGDAPWRPNEFVAAAVIEAVLVGVGLAMILSITGSLMLVVLFVLPVVMFYPELSRKAIHDRAEKRLRSIRMRLPFVIDVIALMMEAGAGFAEALRTVVRENEQHPIGEEFREVLRQVAHGRPRADALRALEQRLEDEDVSGMVFAVVTGEELGTPLNAVLKRQADQMRLKRAQWGEKAAAEAEVKIVFPGMVVMLACLLAVVAPILLPAVLPLLE